MKSVFVIWKDIKDGMWHPVAQLSRNEEGYRLNYTEGSKHINFRAFPRMQDKTVSYVSNELFAFFRNRLLPMNRPEFRKMLNWSDLSVENYDELEMLSISGGTRKTDQYRIIPKPNKVNGNEYKLRFFTSGVSHLPEDNFKRVLDLMPNEGLSFECENNNSHDSNAILVTTIDNKKVKVGYCPKYYNTDISILLNNHQCLDHSLKVVKINIDAPDHFKLLCEFTAEWPKDFISFNSVEYCAYV